MTDKIEPQDPTAATTPAPSRQGGFGAFADQYRDRWAANHPEARKSGKPGASTEPAAGTNAPTTLPAADGAGETPGA